jgi:pilus assembly protein Flp/PilA
MFQLCLYLVNLLRREEGQDLAEYAIMIGLVALVVLVAVTLLGTNLSRLFQDMGSAVGSWVESPGK